MLSILSALLSVVFWIYFVELATCSLEYFYVYVACKLAIKYSWYLVYVWVGVILLKVFIKSNRRFVGPEIFNSYFSLFINYFWFKPELSTFWDQIMHKLTILGAVGGRNFFKVLGVIKNIFHTVKFPKIFIWRPLFKKSSYYGLFVHSRAAFLKIFKK